MQLPTEVDLRHCARDNFLYNATGRQADYDQYYANVANDTVHQELALDSIRSPISKRQGDRLVSALGDFFSGARNVLDFGCGEASLLVELATGFPQSKFVGFEPGPAAHMAVKKAEALSLSNLTVANLQECANHGPYDLVIVSHVMEHILDFGVIDLFERLVREEGLLYVEVPDALKYETQQRLEFLYYFDRLHVNHFTPQSLARLFEPSSFGYAKHFEYEFPYRDGGEYPALGMLFRKGGGHHRWESPRLVDSAERYVAREQERAGIVATALNEYEGVLVWGAGDNFYRSFGNEGPLANVRQLLVLDGRPQEVEVENRRYRALNPEEAIRTNHWPVVVTISEGRSKIGLQVATIDPARRVFFI